ncbi:zinc-dependent alcohol dehydrogenase family protein [Luteococcus sp. Sow4_B9]|uniref:zinc-dependent alcohol dehydrogenase family protein n=1 Tax=Luteococcus sp. Sow4_B9 TaxID=3438792 RepID=UPI003F95EBA4
MYGAVLHAANDVRYEEREDPTIVEPTDAVIRTVATCVCGSDLWRYRGISAMGDPEPVGHEYVGIVEQTGEEVTAVKVGDFVVGGFTFSDNTCPVCLKGAHANCLNGGSYDGCQAEKIRIPQADGTLIATPGQPDEDLIPHLLALSDVMCTGWHAAVSAGVGPGKTVAVVGDGAVGLSGVLASVELGAERVIAMSRHADRQKIAKEFGATDIVPERGEGGVKKIQELTEGIGADCVLECVGTEDSRKQAVDCLRPGGMVGVVGVPHGDMDITQMFWRNQGVQGGVAPVRNYLEHLLQLVLDRKIQPGKVFDHELPLEKVAEAYRAMDERTATKVLLRP